MGYTGLPGDPAGRGIHGLPKVSPGPAKPDLSTPCGRATPKRPYGCLGGGLRPSSSPLDTPRRTGLLERREWSYFFSNFNV
jgi:hypothetical protein